MDKERKNLLVFGYGLPAILLFISARLWIKHGWVLACFILLLGAVFILYLTVFKLLILKRFYERWMKAAHFIGTVISGLILSILFYVVFGSAGVILRVLKKDLLDEKIEPFRDSYWIRRKVTAFDKNCYKNQF